MISCSRGAMASTKGVCSGASQGKVRTLKAPLATPRHGCLDGVPLAGEEKVARGVPVWRENAVFSASASTAFCRQADHASQGVVSPPAIAARQVPTRWVRVRVSSSRSEPQAASAGRPPCCVRR